MANHPYAGMWVTVDGHIRHELLPNGRVTTSAFAPAIVELIGAKAAEYRGVATALYGFSMFLGGSLGSQIVGSLHGLSFTTFLVFIAATFLVGAGLTLLSRALPD
ncbi:Atu4866 domain-containing protein [Salinicola peritrichatus]|uniref:Atu4866 domain-containing protein n=1 Tax=Salinicola peritrichatus TaxID=1267424 RepID=UPI00195503AB|nr:Atu4866 domain-containing protein [Salinicola peritrichatus]